MFLFFYCSQEKKLDYPVQAVVHLQYDKGTSGSHSIVEDVGTIHYVVNEEVSCSLRPENSNSFSWNF